jgi:hypothetical protein
MRGTLIAYSITFGMDSRRGGQSSASAASALRDHAALLLAHTNTIVVRDAHNRIVTLRTS